MNAAARALVSILVALAVLPLAAGPASAAALVQGTVIIVGDATTPVNGSVYFKLEGEGSASGVTLTNGSFSTSAFTDGSYKVFVSISTMDDLRRWYKDGVPGGVAAEADATVVNLASPTEKILDWAVDPIATLSGTVKDGDGIGIAGASVGINRLGSGKSVKADGSGAYTFGYMRPGTVTMSARGPEALGSSTRQVVLPASGSAVEDFVLLPKGHVQGTVTDATSGDPVADISVMAFTTLHNYDNSGTTDASGHFAFDVDPDTYVLRFDDEAFASYPGTFSGGALTIDTATSFAVASGATVTHDEALTAKPDPRLVSHALGGVVTDAVSGDPLAGIAVTASHASDPYTTYTDRWGRWALGTADAPLPDQDYLLRAEQGYQLDNLQPDLVPWFPEFYPDAWTAATATAITVAGDTHDNLDMTLDRAASLAVTVTAAGTGSLHTGYRVFTSTGVLAADVPATTSSPASPTVLLRSGTWKVLASGFRGDTAPGTRLLPQWLGGGVSLSTAGSFAVTTGEKRTTSIGLPGALRASTLPRITGTRKVGRKLVVSKGTWNLMTGTTFKFVWYRGTKVIGRHATHLVVAADRGRTLKVKVTAINGTFHTTVTRKVSVP